MIRFAELSSVLHGSLMVPRAVAPLCLVMPVIDIGLGRFCVEVNTDRSLIIWWLAPVLRIQGLALNGEFAK